MEAKIYITLNSNAQKETKKKYGYVLESVVKGETKTVEGFGCVEATYHAATIQALTEALGRFVRPCKIYVHTEDEYVCSVINEHLEGWAGNNFAKKGGGEVKNKGLWERVWQQMQKHDIKAIPGNNEYEGWIKRELESIEEK